MKNKIIQITLLALTAAIIISFVPRSGDAGEEAKVKIEWGTGIIIPDAANVEKLEAYRLVNKGVDEDQFLVLSNNVLQKSIQKPNIKIARDKIDRVGEDRLAWRDEADPSSFIMQDALNGNLLFSNQMSKFVSLQKVNLPTRDAAIGISRKFLTDLNLRPTDFESNGELLSSGGLFTQSMDKDGVLGQQTEKLMTLTYGRKMNGLQVNGGGSRLVLNIGDEGKIVSFEKRWNSILEKPLLLAPGALKLEEFKGIERKEGMMAPVKIRDFEKQKVELGEIAKPGLVLRKYISGEEVKTQIINMLQNEWTTPDLIKVNSIELVYFDRGGDYIQPAYAFQADIFWGEEVEHWLFHLAALRNAPESIISDVFIESPHISDAAANMQEVFD